MSAREYRFVIETSDGEELVTYEGKVQGVGRIRAVANGAVVQIVQADDDDSDPLVLAAAADPGGNLVLIRDTVRGKGQPVTKKVHRATPDPTTEP